MGLDLVELVMEVEEEFGICLPDERTAGIQTAGGLCDYVKERLAERDRRPCLTASVFYRLRSALVGQLGIERKTVRPSRRLMELIPRRNRRAVWRTVGWICHLQMPCLEYPPWMKRLLKGLFVWGSILAGGVVLWALCLDCSLQAVVSLALALFFGLILVLAGAAWATSPLAVCFPSGCGTLAEAVRSITKRNYGDPRWHRGTSNEQEVWGKLQRIIGDIAGVAPEKVTQQSRLVGDLGLD
jgi:acyl carrier protein